MPPVAAILLFAPTTLHQNSKGTHGLKTVGAPCPSHHSQPIQPHRVAVKRRGFYKPFQSPVERKGDIINKHEIDKQMQTLK